MMIWIVAVPIVILILAIALEVVLLRVSRYRLTHGDGRERAFRGGRRQDPPPAASDPSSAG
jgi:hypothetical protein